MIKSYCTKSDIRRNKRYGKMERSICGCNSKSSLSSVINKEKNGQDLPGVNLVLSVCCTAK